MKIVTLSFAAAVVAASVGMAEAQQAGPDHSASSPASQDSASRDNLRTGRSVGFSGKDAYYHEYFDANQPQSFETLPHAGGSRQ